MTAEETMYELNRLCDLNEEILDRLLIVMKRLFEYTNKHDIRLDGLDSLQRLIHQAECLMKEIDSEPPRIRFRPSDEDLQGKKTDADFTVPRRASLICQNPYVLYVEQ